jgi:hypothetical protein
VHFARRLGGRQAAKALAKRRPAMPSWDMLSFVRKAVLLLVVGIGLIPLPAHAQSKGPQVDLELVLAVDISLSMDLDEQRVQREGYVAAFRDPLVWKAIASGPSGRIAVAYVEWAGPHVQLPVMPWTLIDGEKAAQSFADELEKKPIMRERFTSISAALEFAERMLTSGRFEGRRKVVDVSGDGPNNAGAYIEPTRDRLVQAGIVINGLPISFKYRGGPYSAFDISNLDQYYADCVIGGPGSFSLPVREKSALPEAIRRKLILEISGVTPDSAPRVIPAQLPPPKPQDKADCLIGERMWNDYMLRGR